MKRPKYYMELTDIGDFPITRLDQGGRIKSISGEQSLKRFSKTDNLKRRLPRKKKDENI